ncbi:HNH endonuclease [Kordia algicida OT-1]|uniref:Uncharacterized protein n=1 Tax=Kordia algicida OT-1 TaxID=391587 RepID=A9DRJ8_9FLAO|nr:HNH endonuclease [Kordia algicida]EDP96804.1 hypothetical protein KAOT1_16613 [Kordia algicida OT-1]
MRTFIQKLLLLWGAKKRKKQATVAWLKKYGLKIVYKKETSLILGCFFMRPTRPGKIDLLDHRGNILEKNISDVNIGKYTKKYEDAAQAKYSDLPKDKALPKHLDDLVKEKSLKKLVAKNKKFLDDNNLVTRKTTKGTNVELINKKTGVTIVRGSTIDLEKIIYFLKLNPSEQQKLINKTNNAINTGRSKNRGYKKTPNSKAKIEKKLREAGVNIDIPTAKGGAEIAPELNVLGDRMFLTDGKLGTGNYIDLYDNGITDGQINNFIQKVKQFKGEVRANVTSVRGADFTNCWIEMGIDPILGNKIYKYIDITWHHLDDLSIDLKSRFQLVVTKIHEATFAHMGSDKQIRQLLEIIELN